MQKVQTNAFRWHADERGQWLSVLTPSARSVCESVSDGLYDVTIKPHREKRSLDANAYYWALVGQLAKALNMSASRTHNILLRRFGALEEYDGQAVFIVLPDTVEAEEKAYESETFHVKPTVQVKLGNDGKSYRTYLLLKGSHEYDTAEMSRLIDGVIDECKNVGIDVISESEKALMLEAWR